MTAKLKLETLRPDLEACTFSPSNREATAQISVNSRLASFLQQISDQPRLPSETLSQWNKINKTKNNWIPRFPCALVSYWKENRTVSSNSRHGWVDGEKTHVHFMFVSLLSWKGVKKENSLLQYPLASFLALWYEEGPWLWCAGSSSEENKRKVLFQYLYYFIVALNDNFPYSTLSRVACGCSFPERTTVRCSRKLKDPSPLHFSILFAWEYLPHSSNFFLLLYLMLSFCVINSGHLESFSYTEVCKESIT